MAITGFHHVAITTPDLDRQLRFWQEVFGASVYEEDDGAPFRHAFIDTGDGESFVHLFEAAEDLTGPVTLEPMFRRGRLDHLAIGASDEQTLLDIRARLIDGGFSDERITLFGSPEGLDEVLSVWVVDPDGAHMEVCCFRTGAVIPEEMLTPFGAPVHA